MLLTIHSARHSLSKLGFAIAVVNMAGLALFLLPLFSGEIPEKYILVVMTIAACAGLVIGAYITYRSEFNSTYGLYGFMYGFVILEVMLASGAAALLAQIAGRPDLRWLAFGCSLFCLILTFFGGMHREAKALYALDKTKSEYWKDALKNYFEFNKHLVKPSLTSQMRPLKEDGIQTSYIWIGAGTAANIPLLFEIYAGGRNNAIFLVLPLMLGTFVYVNIKNLGPGFLRLLLLRKLEKSVGYRFINADLEQIQELRRTFFLSRWLMKDYVKPPSATTAVKPNLNP
jgi:hypothetical protein